MAESMISSIESETPGDGCVADASVSASNGSIITRHRKIEFHLARKPFTGIGNGDFRLETLNPSTVGSDSQKAGANNRVMQPSSGKKPDGPSEFLEHWLDPELSFGFTVRRIGAGLENLGNTCFLNSVLQCLTYTEPLAAYLQSGKHQTSCRVAGFCALCAIQKHVSRALQSTGRILAPKDLVSNLRCISRNFRNARQEDAHEYMVNLLESMHKCCLPKGVPSESPSAYEKSLVHKIFGGRLRSQVKCMQCSYCSNTFDPFLDLSLEIAKADSLHKALTNFTATEQLDGGARQYQCQRCKQKVKALKQLTVYKVPYVLTIHLKRFRAHDPGQKIDKKVQFGPTLNLKPFVSGSYEGDLKYTLYGVLVHAGWSTHSGHYYCFVRTASGTWYSVDDNRVVPVGERIVLEQKAYMLFYYRDRRNVGPKKPVDVMQKEHIAAIGLRNEMLSASNQGLKGAVQAGSFEKKISAADTSAAVKREELNVFSTKQTQLKEDLSAQKRNGAVIAESMALKKDTDLESSMAPFVKDIVKGMSVINPKVEKQESLPLSPLVPPVKGSADNHNLGNALPASTAVKINGQKADGCFSKELSVSTTTESNCKPNQSTAIENVVPDKTSKMVNAVSNRGVSSVTRSRDDDDKTSVKIDLIRSPNQPSNENSQVGSIPNLSALGVLPDEKDADTGLKSTVSGLIESSSSPNTLNEPLHMIVPDQKPHRKLKKKVMKCRLASMHLGSNILYGVSLSLLKRKKHKLSRKRSLGINNLTKEHLEDIDLGPSTSEKTRGTSLALTHPRKKRVRSCSEDGHTGNINKKVSNSGDSLINIINGEFIERNDQYGAVPATDKLPHKSSRSSSGVAVNQCDASEPDVLKDVNRESMQNGLMNMLTRGLEETIVARWDGVDLPLSRDVESSGHETVSIGYIPDEWDEEYDRGKRKKVRITQDNFGGPNPFQEIASKKAKLKKAKMDRSSSGNQPFRI